MTSIEIDKMLDMNIIEPSTSPFSSLAVMVKKSVRSWRVCIEFTGPNGVSDLDAEHMPDNEGVLGRFVNNMYFTEIDLCTRYWQSSLSKDSKMYTTYTCILRRVVLELKDTDCNFDNIVCNP